MKIVNGILGVVLVVIPAMIFWADCWFTGTSPKQKYENAMVNMGLAELVEDMDTHAGLMKAFNEKRISRNEYVREMEKLKRKLERESRQAERKIKREIK